jgi:hypothetical protein
MLHDDGAMASMTSSARASAWSRCRPALTLIVVAPLLAEVLPGSTRFSSLFVFPIEMCVWGGGSLLIRYAVRRGRLGWLNMLLLAIALAIAEECLIQQTSLAPLVLRLKGQVYARAWGVNYVYFLWALLNEVVFVVFLPIHLVELIFWDRREGVWINRAGLAAAVSFFVIGSYLAWYTWTQIARPNVFHVPAYNPPVEAILIALATIAFLIYAALGPFRHQLARQPAPLSPPPPWLLGTFAALWAVILYGLVLLSFGIAPSFPEWAAVSIGLMLAASALLLPRWTADPGWRQSHQFSLIFGTMLGSMMAGFIGFIGAAPADLYFKIAVNALAAALMVAIGIKIRRRLRHEDLTKPSVQ